MSAARTFWPLAILLVHSATCRAQDLENIVVTGTRVPRTDPLVTAIGSAEIRNRNDSNVLDLLRDTPGLHVSLPGGRGNVGSFFIRGSEPNYGAVLVDGVQVNDPTNTRGGSFDFSTLSIDAIERIEILKAPQSSIYGSDALGGIINVITHSGTDSRNLTADIEVGTQNQARAGLQVAGPATWGGRYSVRIGGINEGTASTPGEFRSDSLTAKFTSAERERLQLSVFARHAAADAAGFPDDSGGARLAVIRERERRSTSETTLGVRAQTRLTQRSTLNINASVFDHDASTASPGVAPGIRDGIPGNSSTADFTRGALNAFVTSELGTSVAAAYGIDYRREDGRGSGVVTLAPALDISTRYDLERTHVGVFGELDFHFGRGFSVRPALRSDDTDDAGTVTTGKITAVYALPEKPARIHLTWGEGFKLPSLFALADPLVGNPALRPETAESWELGVRWSLPPRGLQLQLVGFEQRFANLIDFDSDSFRIVNRARVDIRGVELDVEYQAAQAWYLSGHATLLDIEVRGGSVMLRQRPEQTAALRLEWKPGGGWGAHLGLHYVGRRLDSSIPTGNRTLASHRTLDLTVNRSLGADLELSLAVDNLTDERFESAIGFADAGRRVRFSVRAAFSGGG